MDILRNNSKKHAKDVHHCLDYIPVIKSRRRTPKNNKYENKFFNISRPTEISKQFYLGEIMIGHTSNIFPKNYDTVKIFFKYLQSHALVCSDEEHESENDDICDSIVVDCDKVIVIIKSYTNTQFIEELVRRRIFVFDFTHVGECVYLKVFFQNLPLPKLNGTHGKTIQTLFSILFDKTSLAEGDSFTLQKKIHGSDIITKLYEKLSKRKKISKNNINIYHPCLKPTLRPYQENSVQWMLQRENNHDENYKGILHPLYTIIKLESGLEIYFDKYTGHVTSEKPLVNSTDRGGILADEMGLGKTVEVLACILLNPKKTEAKIIETGDVSNLTDPVFSKTQKRKLENGDSCNDFNSTNTPLIGYKSVIEDSDEEDELPIIRKPTKKQKVDNNVEETKEIKICEDKVNQSSKKSANKVALELWYTSILEGMSTTHSLPHEDPDKVLVQCVCGNTSEEGIIKCTKCSKYQHGECLGYKKSLGKYMCPQCWNEEPLLDSKATLIVTPGALKTQWCKEISRHIKGNIKVLQYDGIRNTPIYPTELKEYDIVLTTYSVLQNELKFTENGQIIHLRKKQKYCPPSCPLTRLKWWRLCLDEAQIVETPGRKVTEMAKKIDAANRWAVTGTPISKNLSDLHVLVNYLLIEPYNDITTWKKILFEPYLSGEEEPLLSFLTKVFWRTARNDVSNQINIPQQTYIEHALEFSAVEKYFYKKEHELTCANFYSKAVKYDFSIHLEDLDKDILKHLMTPLLALRHACSYPNTVTGRYLATKKQVKSMKELLDALILKNKTDSEDCLRLIISSLNGISGIHLLVQNSQEAINNYRQVLQLAARFSGERDEAKLTIDKPQVIHTLHNLAEVIEMDPPDHPTLRDGNLKKDCRELENKYMEKFIGESSSAFESFNTIMLNIEQMQNNFILKDGQWYSDGLNWIVNKGFFKDLQNRLQTACENASVSNTLWNASDRVILQLVYRWDKDMSDLRSTLFEAIQDLYDNQMENGMKIVVKENLVAKAMNCHLRPQKKGKKAAKCSVCVASYHLKKYEAKLFGMQMRVKTFEDMSLKGSWKPTLQELVLKTIHTVLKSKNSNNEYIKDGELHANIIDNLKKEFKEISRLWRFLDQQICAKDEIDICKIRLQLKMDDNQEKVNQLLKNLNYDIENKTETINLLSVHELDYQLSLLENESKQNSLKLEKLLGIQSYLDTLRKQQYEGESPDPCPICKNTLEQHWSILLCGHSYCLECIQVLLEQNGFGHLQCSICRNKQKYQDISYIKAGNTVTEDDTRSIHGNYSAKVDGIIKVILDLKNKDPSVKVLLFSSWPTVLKYLKEALVKNSITCELACSSNLDSIITSFKDLSKNVMVLLLPIHLGSKGLNLIEATHVILVEPLLNPADELQAIGRVNRIGQTKETFVHKFFIKNTVEENIHQATKSNAEKWDKSRVTLQHLVNLFYTKKLCIEIDGSQILETSVSAESLEVESRDSEILLQNRALEPSIEVDNSEINLDNN